MEDTLLYKIESELKSIHMRRHQLLFVVSESFNRDISFIAKQIGIPNINLNYELSKVLKNIPAKKRHRNVSNSLKQIVREKNSTILVIDHIEILYDPQLQQDPVALLEDISRNYTLIVSWSGKTNGENLVYADQDHVEYYKRDKTDGVILSQ
ncbi:BREX-3 system P-loop-containing protein BrxF [Pontibacillus litoralis]|uniref:BREX-3 system P-loop-containing protein BrxF n=1 Tax=Pontibacillus litoralis JSM 072002 TaxID=1385512 RepID=A0A0A5FVM1_9BACI|nr:BREX-3 system P-loop-containing protein BrxF [Pontibacillus litoralis]KGX84851.1 hypothetical protein N784_11785 [Pontibacillus litoralis JSM 072002]